MHGKINVTESTKHVFSPHLALLPGRGMPHIFISLQCFLLTRCSGLNMHALSALKHAIPPGHPCAAKSEADFSENRVPGYSDSR
jgi:hypothetical protein